MKTFRNIWRQKFQVKVISSVTVDKDVQSMFLPFNLMEYITFCPKYTIKDNFITPNSLKSYLISMIGTFIMILVFIYRTYMIFFYYDCYGRNFTLNYIACFDCIFYCFGFIMNFVHGIILTRKSIKFVFTFQKVHRFLNNDTSVSQFIIWNWISIIGYTFGHTVFFITFCVFTGEPYYLILSLVICVLLDLNMIYATRGITLLKNKVVLWNVKAMQTQEMKDTNSKNYSKEMFQAYVDILKCYNIHKFCFQRIVSTLVFVNPKSCYGLFVPFSLRPSFSFSNYTG